MWIHRLRPQTSSLIQTKLVGSSQPSHRIIRLAMPPQHPECNYSATISREDCFHHVAFKHSSSRAQAGVGDRWGLLLLWILCSEPAQVPDLHTGGNLAETGLSRKIALLPFSLPVLEIGVTECWGREEVFPHWYITKGMWRFYLFSSLPALSHGHERSGIKATEANVLTLC